MKKILVCLLLAAALCGFAVAEEMGLSIGAEVWNTPGKDLYGDNTFSFGPFAEFEKSFSSVDLYLKGQYLVNLDDETNQALYLEEKLTFNLGKAGPGSLSLSLGNYNLLGTKIDKDEKWHYFYPPNDYLYVDASGNKKITGVFSPSAAYALAPLTFSAGVDIGYAPGGSAYMGEYVDAYGKVEFAHESGLGFDAVAYYNISKEWDNDKTTDDLYEIDVSISYTKKDVFKAALEVYFLKDSEGNFMKNYAFIPGIEIYVKNFTFYGKVDIRTFKDKTDNGWNENKKTSTGFLVGAKMKF